MLIRSSAPKPRIVTIDDGYAAIDIVIRGALTLAEDAHFLERLTPAGGASAQNQDVWLAAIMTLIVMRQDLMQELTGLPADPIPLDATPADVLGDVSQLSTRFASLCFDLFMAEKNSTPVDERPKELQGKVSDGMRSGLTSSTPSPQTPAGKRGSGSRAA